VPISAAMPPYALVSRRRIAGCEPYADMFCDAPRLPPRASAHAEMLIPPPRCRQRLPRYAAAAADAHRHSLPPPSRRRAAAELV